MINEKSKYFTFTGGSAESEIKTDTTIIVAILATYINSAVSYIPSSNIQPYWMLPKLLVSMSNNCILRCIKYTLKTEKKMFILHWLDWKASHHDKALDGKVSGNCEKSEREQTP